MVWYQQDKLRPAAREAAREWVTMNPKIPGTPVVIPVSSTAAVIEYVQDRKTEWLFFYFGKGDTQPLYLSPAALQRNGNKLLQLRVEEARRNYRFYQLDAEREQLVAYHNVE
jgi:hypothetical protein